ncbi:MAG: prepilin-type N-terminal cleavage/methylation domain-containing protein [Psychromonas sp.]|nr:prepilin-type N-terminal cleavage/methylation domain-containing protein [Alteromonadales bacterium]MCP5078153.1 prepilin-type N-terminal cleavage/methylation domain-containing protein [Psychromonas sp.]
MKNKQQGFTLFEVLISMFIAAVAVLGLVMLELNILRSSQSSFNYTLATIEANSLVDKVWMQLCEIGKDGNTGDVHKNLYEDWVYGLRHGYNHTVFSGTMSSSSPSAFNTSGTVVVEWVDKNYAAIAGHNQVTLNVTYPDFDGGCP